MRKINWKYLVVRYFTWKLEFFPGILWIIVAVLSEPRLLIPQYTIIWSELKSRTVGFTWSCMHPNFAELNCHTLTRHLWVSFLVDKKPFNFFTMLSWSSYSFCRVFWWRRQGDIIFYNSTVFIATIVFIIIIIINVNTIGIIIISYIPFFLEYIVQYRLPVYKK